MLDPDRIPIVLEASGYAVPFCSPQVSVMMQYFKRPHMIQPFIDQMVKCNVSERGWETKRSSCSLVSKGEEGAGRADSIRDGHREAGYDI